MRLHTAENFISFILFNVLRNGWVVEPGMVEGHCLSSVGWPACISLTWLCCPGPWYFCICHGLFLECPSFFASPVHLGDFLKTHSSKPWLSFYLPFLETFSRTLPSSRIDRSLLLGSVLLLLTISVSTVIPYCNFLFSCLSVTVPWGWKMYLYFHGILRFYIRYLVNFCWINIFKKPKTLQMCFYLRSFCQVPNLWRLQSRLMMNFGLRAVFESWSFLWVHTCLSFGEIKWNNVCLRLACIPSKC